MLKNSIKATVLSILMVFNLGLEAQNIIINEELAAHSEPMKVKIGVQGFGKIAKWKFGEYTVTESKNGWTTTKSKSKLFSAKTESVTKHKFSFTLSNASSDNAIVNAAENMEIKAIQAWLTIEGFTFGNDELLQANQNFSASVIVNNDTTDTWTLLMNTSVGSETENTGRAVLLGKERKVLIVSASSNKNGTDKRMFPALGYEFIENDTALAALQYYGGGALGNNKNIVWIRNDLDQKMKLILAAVSTAIMQNKLNDTAAMD